MAKKTATEDTTKRKRTNGLITRTITSSVLEVILYDPSARETTSKSLTLQGEIRDNDKAFKLATKYLRNTPLRVVDASVISVSSGTYAMTVEDFITHAEILEQVGEASTDDAD